MRIDKVSNINFKANYYTVRKTGSKFNLKEISTDNEEKLGNEPVLQAESSEIPMAYDGKYYTAKYIDDIDNYRIYYKDTGLYERNGEEQIINPLDFIKTATIEDRKSNSLSLEHAYSKGQASGKVFVNTLDIPKDIPVIMILDEIKSEATVVLEVADNVKGVITASAKSSTLSHAANLARNHLSAMSIIWDDDKFNELKNLEGKYIHIDNESGILEYSETKPMVYKPEKIKRVDIPKLDNVEKLLDFDELTPQNCGNKGYRLGVMQKLADEGKLKNINIPKGFVIPEGYINKLNEYINVEDNEKRKELLRKGIYAQDINRKVEELGMDKRFIIVRSNFNSEDLGSFSSAGIYWSGITSSDCVLSTTLDVIESKDSNIAQKIHQRYGIKDSQIQPSVIVQDEIAPDYDFTMYSDDGDNNILIEIGDWDNKYVKPEYALIKYNKKTKEITVEKIRQYLQNICLMKKVI